MLIIMLIMFFPYNFSLAIILTGTNNCFLKFHTYVQQFYNFFSTDPDSRLCIFMWGYIIQI